MATELFDRALQNAIYWQNRCCDLEEIIELFCLDADAVGVKECEKHALMNTLCLHPTEETCADSAESQKE